MKMEINTFLSAIIKKNFSPAVIAFLFLIFLIITVTVQNAAADPTVQVKEIQGTVNTVTSNFIAVTYNSDPKAGTEDEIAFPIDDIVLFSNKKKLKEFNVGDTVRITFEESTDEHDETKPDGKVEHVKKVDSKPKKIQFVSPAPPNLSSGQ